MQQEKWKARPLEMPEAPRELRLKRSRWRWRMRWLRMKSWSGWLPCITGMQLLVMLGLFLYSGPWLRLVDPTSASMDVGVVNILLFSILVVDASVVSAWLMVRLIRNILPVRYSLDESEDELLTQKVEPCLEAKIMTGSFWGLVLLSCLGFWVLL